MLVVQPSENVVQHCDLDFRVTRFSQILDMHITKILDSLHFSVIQSFVSEVIYIYYAPDHDTSLSPTKLLFLRSFI